MTRYKDYARFYVPWDYQIAFRRARRINYFRAIEMVGRSNMRKFIERSRAKE